MKIFLEGSRRHFSVGLKAARGSGDLFPGENEVPDEVGKAILDGCAADCDRKEADIRKKLIASGELKPNADGSEPTIPQALRPKPTFRLVVPASPKVPSPAEQMKDAPDIDSASDKDSKLDESDSRRRRNRS